MHSQAQQQAIVHGHVAAFKRASQRALPRARPLSAVLQDPWHALPPPTPLDPPWRTGRRRLARATASRHPPTDASSPAFPSLHDLSGQLPPVDWLWPSWIPRGLLTLFGAAPGAGKSLVALDLARRIIHDEPFPDGAPVPCPGSNVLIVDAEGAPALLNQRAQAWQIDRRRLFLMLAPDPSGLVDLAQPRQQLLLLEMVRDLRPALVVVDSLAAATARGETSLQGARAILGFLSTVAGHGRLAMLVIHHLRKGAASGRAHSARHVVADDLRGSSHISAAARSVLALSLIASSPLLSRSPSPASSLGALDAGPGSHRQPDLRRLEVVKSNLCRCPPPLSLIFQGGDQPVPTLHYTELVEPPTQLDLCARWLLQFLTAAGAPVKPADAIRAAAGAGFPRSTLYRARQALAGAIIDLGTGPRDPRKRWTLAADLSPRTPPDGPTPKERPTPEEGAHRDSGTVGQ